MRVIAGKAKGVRLSAPAGLAVRPTLDRVREALFSILGPRLDGAHFLDLFAGSGANGIEALSRGAKSCTFIDNAVRARDAILENLKKAHLADHARLSSLRLPAGIRELAQEDFKYDIVFADPPYGFKEYHPLLQHTQEGQLLAPDGIVVIEHATRRPMPEGADLELVRQAVYGDTTLSFFS